MFSCTKSTIQKKIKINDFTKNAKYTKTHLSRIALKSQKFAFFMHSFLKKIKHFNSKNIFEHLLLTQHNACSTLLRAANQLFVANNMSVNRVFSRRHLTNNYHMSFAPCPITPKMSLTHPKSMVCVINA